MRWIRAWMSVWLLLGGVMAQAQAPLTEREVRGWVGVVQGLASQEILSEDSVHALLSEQGFASMEAFEEADERIRDILLALTLDAVQEQTQQAMAQIQSQISYRGAAEQAEVQRAVAEMMGEFEQAQQTIAQSDKAVVAPLRAWIEEQLGNISQQE